jgi:AcrR family transcriptional regulator
VTSIENGSRVRRGRPGHSLDSLLDVAVAVFNERGYDATSMEELATRLGVTKSAIYHHVSSKVELLRLALDRALDALFAVTEEPGATTGPAIDRLEHVVRGSARSTRWSSGTGRTAACPPTTSPTHSSPRPSRACAPGPPRRHRPDRSVPPRRSARGVSR